MNLFTKSTNGVIVAHILERDAIHFEDHVARFDATILGHCPTLHNRPHVDAIVTGFCGLAHNGDAQEVDCVHIQSYCDDVQRHGGVCDAAE